MKFFNLSKTWTREYFIQKHKKPQTNVYKKYKQIINSFYFLKKILKNPNLAFVTNNYCLDIFLINLGFKKNDKMMDTSRTRYNFWKIKKGKIEWRDFNWVFIIDLNWIQQEKVSKVFFTDIQKETDCFCYNSSIFACIKF